MPELESSDLLRWPDVQEREWGGILIGNGASIAFWDEFAYDSIFERARTVANPLDPDDIGVFDAFDTTNFEHVLAALKTSRIVLSALSYDSTFIRERYESIQRALFEAVHSVHVPWGLTSSFNSKLEAIRDELETYAWVYSLNYDLILYWAVMSKHGGKGIGDFFWQNDGSFDPGNAVLADWASDWTQIVWLHGGIHLRRHVDGTIYKQRAEGSNLLDKFKTSYTGDVTPLLVSEGTADDKYRAITRSSYLDFGLRRLSEHEGGLVVFGSSLRSEDQHLVRAINEQPVGQIAVSIRPSNDAPTIRQRKAELRGQFPSSDLYFFDATTHPFGEPGMRVKRSKLRGWRS